MYREHDERGSVYPAAPNSPDCFSARKHSPHSCDDPSRSRGLAGAVRAREGAASRGTEVEEFCRPCGLFPGAFCCSSTSPPRFGQSIRAGISLSTRTRHGESRTASSAARRVPSPRPLTATCGSGRKMGCSASTGSGLCRGCQPMDNCYRVASSPFYRDRTEVCGSELGQIWRV